MNIALTFNKIMENFSGYFGGKRMFVLFVLCMILLAVYHRKSILNRKVLLYVLILLAVIFCPFSAYVIMYDMIGVEVYWRMFWLLPVSLVVAYVSAVFIDKYFWTAAVLIAVMVFCGNNLYLQNRIVLPQNFYKVDSEVVEMVSLINDEAASREKKVCFPSDMYCYVRQVDASIKMPYGRNVEKKSEMSDVQRRLYKVMEAENIDYERLRKLLRKNDCDYVVMGNEIFPANMEQAGFALVGETEGHRLYKV